MVTVGVTVGSPSLELEDSHVFMNIIGNPITIYSTSETRIDFLVSWHFRDSNRLPDFPTWVFVVDEFCQPVADVLLVKSPPSCLVCLDSFRGWSNVRSRRGPG